jgi:hypothetical protein
MRASILSSVLLFCALLPAVPADAQVTRTPDLRPIGVSVPAFQLGDVPTAPTWQHRVLTAVGSAALGAGIGYFASQLSRGDWDDGPGQPQVNRPAWAAVGGSIGLAVGYSFPVFGRGTAPGVRSIPAHQIITAEEIEEVVAVDAYEAVDLLRPQWLVRRPGRVLGNSLPQTRTPVGGTLTEGFPVYLDDFRLGGVDQLRGLGVHRIESIQFVPAAVATTRWGVGNSYGAIQVVTKG